MRRRVAIAVFALGTVLGYGSGIWHLAHAHRVHCNGCHHEQTPPSG
jgi:hypothetical protein